MKNIFIIFTFLMIANSTYAVEIIDARVNQFNNTIEVDIAYGGGCEEHTFQLEVGACLESYPAQCSAQVKDVSPKADLCEAYIHQTVVFNMADYGLNDSYYERASLTIFGFDRTSQKTVTLP